MNRLQTTRFSVTCVLQSGLCVYAHERSLGCGLYSVCLLVTYLKDGALGYPGSACRNEIAGSSDWSVVPLHHCTKGLTMFNFSLLSSRWSANLLYEATTASQNPQRRQFERLHLFLAAYQE